MATEDLDAVAEALDDTTGAPFRHDESTPILSHLTVEERQAQGKEARSGSPRSGHADVPEPERDPVALLEAQAVSRVPELVPIRYGRMLVSPFTFYRGAAAIMAFDLSRVPNSGLQAQLCGDAHLANFGGFASPERDLIFDLNDFDETLEGPFEWDVKRLAASFEIAGRNRRFDAATCRGAVLETVRSYREAMRLFSTQGNMEVWYERLSAADIAAQLKEQGDDTQFRNLERARAKAMTKDSLSAFEKLTHVVDGEPRFRSDPPLIVPVEDLMKGVSDRNAVEGLVRSVFRDYRATLEDDRRHLLEQFRFVDLAHKVVGVGSVGTRCWIVLLLGRDATDPLIIQVKEAQSSVLEPYLRKSPYASHGQRVVAGQRLMQAASDIFLGWHRTTGLDGHERDFYCRQLWDWKVSVNLETIPARSLVVYGRVCGWTLARAHARSGDRVAIAEYLGKGDVFDTAMADFAVAYAGQNERDYKALAKAAKSGRIHAEEGV
jgi:uncharacterized protein (DUF2252 family)